MGRQTLRKDKETGEWISKAEWHAKYGEDDVVRKTANNIISDIEPYRSTIDGSVIGSRSTHRQHLKDHGCVEVGTENIETAKKQIAPKKQNADGLKEAVIDAYNKVEANA